MGTGTALNAFLKQLENQSVCAVVKRQISWLYVITVLGLCTWTVWNHH